MRVETDFLLMTHAEMTREDRGGIVVYAVVGEVVN